MIKNSKKISFEEAKKFYELSQKSLKANSKKRNKRKNDYKVIEKEEEVKVVEEDFTTFFKEEE